jgi:chromate transporter
MAAGGGAAGTIGLWPLFLVFLKLGVVVFGSGYVLLAFLQKDLVEQLHWVTQGQLLDAVTAGQVTPGPLFASATFLGYLIGGWSGAAVATIAIFVPSFFLADVAAMLAERIRR